MARARACMGLVFLAFLIPLGGCGGGSTSSPRVASPLTPAAPAPTPTAANGGSAAAVVGSKPTSLTLPATGGITSTIALPPVISGGGATVTATVAPIQPGAGAAQLRARRLSGATLSGPLLSLTISSSGPVTFASAPAVTFASTGGSLGAARLRVASGAPPLLSGITVSGTAVAGGESFTLPSTFGAGSTSSTSLPRARTLAASAGAWTLSAYLLIPPPLVLSAPARSPLPQFYVLDATGGGFDGSITAFWNVNSSGATSSSFTLGLPVTGGVFAADAAADIFFISSGAIYENTLLGNIKIASDSLMASGTVSSLAVDPSGAFVAVAEGTSAGTTDRIAIFYKGALAAVVPVTNVSYDGDFSSFNQTYAYELAFDSKANLYATPIGGNVTFEFSNPQYASDMNSTVLRSGPLGLATYGFALDASDARYYANFIESSSSAPNWLAATDNSTLLVPSLALNYHTYRGDLNWELGGIDRTGNLYVQDGFFGIHVFPTAGWPSFKFALFLSGKISYTGSPVNVTTVILDESLLQFTSVSQIGSVPAVPASPPHAPSSMLPSGAIQAAPSAVVLQPSALSAPMAVTEAGYSGAFTELDDCGTIATLAPTATGFTVTAGTTFGLCSVTIFDSYYQSGTASVEYVPSTSAGSPAMISFTPSAVNLTGVGQSAVLAVNDGSYAGAFAATSASTTPCSSIATVVQQGALNSFLVTGTAAGTCTETFTDATGNRAAVPINVAVTTIVGQSLRHR